MNIGGGIKTVFGDGALAVLHGLDKLIEAVLKGRHLLLGSVLKNMLGGDIDAVFKIGDGIEAVTILIGRVGKGSGNCECGQREDSQNETHLEFLRI